MTRPHLIAKLLLAAAGIHFLMDFLSEIISIIITLQHNYAPEALTIRMFIVIVKLIITLVVSLIFLFKSDWLIKIIVGPLLDQCETVSSRWIITGFRITACFCGLLIIYPRIERFSYYLHLIMSGPDISSYFTLQGESEVSAKTFTAILIEITKWIIAMYLVFGASHYANWQVQSTAVKQGVKI